MIPTHIVDGPVRVSGAIPGMLDGWAGPVTYQDYHYARGELTKGRWVPSACGAGGMANGVAPDHIRLDPSRREVRLRLADWFADKSPIVGRMFAEPLWMPNTYPEFKKLRDERIAELEKLCGDACKPAPKADAKAEAPK